MKNIRLFFCVLLLCRNSADSLLAHDDFSCSTSCHSCDIVDDAQDNACIADSVDEKEVSRDHVSAFFTCAQEELASVSAQITKSALSHSQEKQLRRYLQKLTILDCIARRDIQGLVSAKKSELESYSDDLYVSVDAGRCKDTMHGRLVSFIFDAENALPFVLYHAALDTTDNEKQATLAMLEVLFSKGLDVSVCGGHGYWLKQKASDDTAYDYVGESSLEELAKEYSFKEAQELVAQYCSASH